jgi:hypothetical protein
LKEDGTVITSDESLVGAHFLTSEDGEQVLTKIELDPGGDVSLKRNRTRKPGPMLLFKKSAKNLVKELVFLPQTKGNFAEIVSITLVFEKTPFFC